jgi:FKBP-type peptidyl-prolyl cis-trans isomerase
VFRSAVLVIAFVACASSGGARQDETFFDPSLDIQPALLTTTGSGLRYRDFTPGQGVRATAGDLVQVRYTVQLANGTRVDASSPDGPPYQFRLGRREVIAGWDEGIAGMRTGGRRLLIIPPSLGYGVRSRGAIPPNSVLVVNIHLVSIGN